MITQSDVLSGLSDLGLVDCYGSAYQSDEKDVIIVIQHTSYGFIITSNHMNTSHDESLDVTLDKYAVDEIADFINQATDNAPWK